MYEKLGDTPPHGVRRDTIPRKADRPALLSPRYHPGWENIFGGGQGWFFEQYTYTLVRISVEILRVNAKCTYLYTGACVWARIECSFDRYTHMICTCTWHVMRVAKGKRFSALRVSASSRRLRSTTSPLLTPPTRHSTAAHVEHITTPRARALRLRWTKNVKRLNRASGFILPRGRKDYLHLTSCIQPNINGYRMVLTIVWTRDVSTTSDCFTEALNDR